MGANVETWPVVGSDVVVQAFGSLRPGRVELLRMIRGRLRVTVSFLQRRGEEASRTSRSFAAAAVRRPDHATPWCLDVVRRNRGRHFVAVRYVGARREERSLPGPLRLHPGHVDGHAEALERLEELRAADVEAAR